MSEQRKLIPGKFVWYEHVSRDAKKAQAFYGDLFGWKVEPFPMGGGATYDMIKAGEQMLGGYAAPEGGSAAHWISYACVESVDDAVKIATGIGGRLVTPAYDVPQVGRMARIADPQGGELCVYTSFSGNDPDVADVPVGTFTWNELHTTDPKAALSFYGKVVGFTHRSMDMGPAGTYFIVGRNGIDRGGVTPHLPPGAQPHWLPYVRVENTDASLARAKKAGAKVLFGPEDIAGVGRFATFEDPTGAVLAIIKPSPQ